jgi:hypothetical protein
MADRLNLHEELCIILGHSRAYFQPPASFKMSYDCIRYSLAGINSLKADDKNYKNTKRYELVVMDTNPDSDIYLKILEHFPMCSFDRYYVADNLHHWVLTLYY